MRKTFRLVKKKAKAIFRSDGQASPVAQILSQNNSASTAPVLLDSPEDGKGLPPQVIIRNPSTEEVELSSASNNDDSVQSPQHSSMSKTHDGFKQLSSPSPMVVRDGPGHTLSSTQVLVHNGNDNSEQLSTLNEKSLLDDSGSVLRPQVLGRPETSFNPSATHYTAHNYGGGTVDRAQNISFENATIYEFHGNQNVNYNTNTSNAVLDRLAGSSMLDATFDSSIRDPPPRCHPGTRLSILQSIKEKLRDSDKRAQVDWLQGAAGVGKSAVMQTIAEAEAENNTLGASLFFSRPNKRDDPRKVFTTIAYQLAVIEPSYQQYLAEKIAVDPSFLHRTMDKQFNDLIVIPFAQRQLLGDSCGRVILLDGLDECKGNREQCRIIKLIHDFISNYPNVRLRWVIASRPEEHLRIAFSDVRSHLVSLFWEKEIPVDSEQSVRDVEIYLDDEFTKIRERYPDLTIAYDKWPSETQFLTISRAASGLFIFASTIIRFIDDDENPVYRLNIVVAFLEKRLKQHSWINPLELLDAFYGQILSEMSPDTLNTVKLILGYLIVFLVIGLGENRRPFWMCNLLGLEQYIVYGALRKLRSVLTFPEPQGAFVGQVRFLHASFSDYLKDRERSHIYSVNLDETTTFLFRRFMTILQQYAEHGSYDVDYSWSIESLMKISQGSQEKPRVLKQNLVDKAGYYWAILLQEHLEHKLTIAFRLLLPLEEIVKQIKLLDYSYPYCMSDFDKLNDLTNYLKRDVSVCSLEDLTLDVPLASLDKTRFLNSVYVRRWISGPAGRTDPFEKLESQTLQELGENLEELERFLRNNCEKARLVLDLLQSANASELKATIFGTRPLKCRALVVPVKGTGNNAYSFPYFV